MEYTGEPITEVYWLISILLFGSVLIFVIYYISAFYKGMKTGEVPKKFQNNGEHNMKRYVRQKNAKAICKKCGAKIDNDSKFCKNCGTPIN